MQFITIPPQAEDDPETSISLPESVAFELDRHPGWTGDFYYPHGTPVVVSTGSESWQTTHAIYLGPVGRGLHLVLQGNGPLFYRAPEIDREHGGRLYPQLDKSFNTWTLRKVRPSTIVGQCYALQLADERAKREKREREELALNEERAKDAARSRIAKALDQWSGVEVYAHNGNIRVIGGSANIDRLADVLEAALAGATAALEEPSDPASDFLREHVSVICVGGEG